MSSTQPIRIVIVDDHPLVREGLAGLFEHDASVSVCGTATNGIEAVHSFESLQPDVMLMDIGMPEMDGIEATKTILKKHTHAKIIVLTTFMGDKDVYHAFKAGAKAYLLKDAPIEEILKTINLVHQGQRCIPPSIAAQMAEYVSSPELTAREVEVLYLLANGESNKEIARKLFISRGTVKTHVNAIFAKLKVNNRTEAVSIALKRGIIRLP
jgi:two-component system NarL family response regulator